MKHMITFAILIVSMSSFAGCLDKVTSDYRELTIQRNYDYDWVGLKSSSIADYSKRWSTFTTQKSGDQYEVFEGQSEYMSGLGIDALIVDRNTCETVEVIEVYAE
jgi:hypothetical protein